MAAAAPREAVTAWVVEAGSCRWQGHAKLRSHPDPELLGVQQKLLSQAKAARYSGCCSVPLANCHLSRCTRLHQGLPCGVTATCTQLLCAMPAYPPQPAWEAAQGRLGTCSRPPRRSGSRLRLRTQHLGPGARSCRWCWVAPECCKPGTAQRQVCYQGKQEAVNAHRWTTTTSATKEHRCQERSGSTVPKPRREHRSAGCEGGRGGQSNAGKQPTQHLT